MNIKATHNTVIKNSTAQSSTLQPSDVYQLKAGEIFPTESVEDMGSYYKITAYAFKGHVETINDNNSDHQNNNNQPTTISQQGINLIKQFEGLRLQAYQDSGDVWTIGYGHTETAKPGMTIDEEKAEQLLKQDLERFEQAVRENVTVPINQNQFDALVSFSFNVGVNALKNSTLLEKLNQGDYDAAKAEFNKWVNAGGRKLDGLVRRRTQEANLFAA